jgi:hypothetical protein
MMIVGRDRVRRRVRVEREAVPDGVGLIGIRAGAADPVDQQAREVVAGATADPKAEPVLLGTAASDSLKELRNESRRAQAVDDAEGRQKAIHARRGLRMRVDTDGTFRLSFAGTA